MTPTLDLLSVRRMGVDELVFRLRDALTRQRLDGWELRFAVSIVARSKRGEFVPTARQETCMRRIVSELRHNQPSFGGEASLIDESDGGGE